MIKLNQDCTACGSLRISNNLKFLRITFVGMCAFIASHAAHAHSTSFDETQGLPSCESVADDPDGDGFGWVPHPSDPHSCIIDESTFPIPQFADIEGTLRPLNMMRTFWDPNVDFVGKEISCTHFSTEERQVWHADADFSITHYPLPDNPPWLSEYELSISFERSGTQFSGHGIWRAAHGTYFNAPFDYNPDHAVQFMAGYWGEPIELNGQQGMRFWFPRVINFDQPEVISGDDYQECFYTSGEPFRPTGRWDLAPTQSNWTMPPIEPLNPGPPESEKPVYTNPETGELVELTSFSWNVAEDLLYKGFSCDSYFWTGSQGDYGNGIWDAFEFATGMVMLPPISGDTGKVYVNFNSRRPTGLGNEWTIEDGELTGLIDITSSGWYDRTEFGSFRIWLSEFNILRCAIDPGSSPMGHMIRGIAFSDQLTATGAVSADNTQNNIVDANESTASDDTNTDDMQSASTSDSVQINETSQIDNMQDSVVDANESVGQADATAPDDTDTNDTQPESTGGSFQDEETTQIDSGQSSAGGGSMSEAVLLLLFVYGLRRRVSDQNTHQL